MAIAAMLSATQPEPAQSAKKTRKNPARRKAQRAQPTLYPVEATKPAAKSKSPPVTTANPGPARAQSSSSLLTLQQPRKAPTAIQASQKQVSSTQARAQSTAKPSGTPLSRTVSQPSPIATDSPTSMAHTAPAMLSGGLLGCLASAAFLPAISAWQEVSGPAAAITSIRAARASMDNLSEEMIASLQTGTYSTDEALDMLRRATLAYACVIPGGVALVDRVFKEVELVRHARGAEVERIAGAAWREMQTTSKKGGDADEVRGVVLKHLGRLSGLASRVSRDVVTRNPVLDAKTAPKRPGMPKERVPSTTVNLTVKHKSG